MVHVDETMKPLTLRHNKFSNGSKKQTCRNQISYLYDIQQRETRM
jgi:hypothetical protein